MDFCLSLQSATEPFKTCLVGLPGFDPEDFKGYVDNYDCNGIQNASDCAALLIRGLNVILPWDPQELELLGSQKIGNLSTTNWTRTCFAFGTKYQGNLGYWVYRKMSQQWTDVSPGKPYTWGNGREYCGVTPWMSEKEKKRPALDAVYGAGVGQTLWNNGSARALPNNTFLICGDRAWQGIPKNVIGGPCYLGKLTLFAPHKRDWLNMIQAASPGGGSRQKRATKWHNLKADCNDNVQLWSITANVFVTAFIPHLAVAQAVKQLERLTCWSVKEANATTQVLEQLLLDQNSLRHALLQNRAAIDFLLLAQGHGCSDFEGMCCFNLSDHGESIHKQLAWLKNHTNRIIVNENPFDQWLRSTFGGLSPWILQLIKEGLRLLGIVLLTLILLRIGYGCILRGVDRVTGGTALLAQKEKRGIVAEWLKENGHDLEVGKQDEYMELN
ncbi:uncharacterized protein LOC135179081 [Pogoniulus pusillus]